MCVCVCVFVCVSVCLSVCLSGHAILALAVHAIKSIIKDAIVLSDRDRFVAILTILNWCFTSNCLIRKLECFLHFTFGRDGHF